MASAEALRQHLSLEAGRFQLRVLGASPVCGSSVWARCEPLYPFPLGGTHRKTLADTVSHRPALRSRELAPPARALEQTKVLCQQQASERKPEGKPPPRKWGDFKGFLSPR